MGIPVQVTFDCADPDRVAKFWALALDYKFQEPPPGFDTWEAFARANNIPEEEWSKSSAVVDPEGKGPRLYFQKVPEGNIVKNRVHLDVNVGGGQKFSVVEQRQRIYAKRDQLIAAGARELRASEEYGEFCIVMQDIEGNEFCLQ